MRTLKTDLLHYHSKQILMHSDYLPFDLEILIVSQNHFRNAIPSPEISPR